MCVLYQGHARANKGQNAKIRNDFGKYVVLFVWKSLSCVNIGTEGPDMISFYYYYLYNFRQST